MSHDASRARERMMRERLGGGAEDIARVVTSGETGPILVFAYAQPSHREQDEAVAAMADLCEEFEGTFDVTVEGDGRAR